MSPALTVAAWFFVIVATVYLGICVVIWLVQDRLVFVMRWPLTLGECKAAAQREDAELVQLETEGIVLTGWFLAPTVKRWDKSPVIVLFGGNGENLANTIGDFGAYRANGYAVCAFSYRGYGHSGGEPSEKAFFHDAEFVYDWLTAREDVDAEGVTAWGRSLGSSVAVHLAANRKLRSVVLISAFSKISVAAKTRYRFLPVEALLKYKFDSASLAGRIETPMLEIHGTQDALVTYEDGKRLIEAWHGPVKHIRIEGGGHNFRIGQDQDRRILEFLKKYESVALDVQSSTR